MARAGLSPSRGMGVPLGASALLHAVVIAVFVVQRGGAPPPMPPTYKVDLVAAPAGPRAQARPLSSKSGMVVTVRRDGRIYVDDAPVSLAEFRASFKSLAERRGSAGVYLRADSRVDYGTVVQVLAVMRASGVGDVGLVAEPEEIR